MPSGKALGSENLGGDWVLRAQPPWKGLALLENTEESSLASASMWGHSETMAIYEAGSRISSDTHRTCRHLDLELPKLQNCKKHILLFPSHCSHGILLQQLRWTETDYYEL